MKKTCAFLILFFSVLWAYSQEVYEHISTAGIYEFLDELAANLCISLNSAIKPYPRNLIAMKLSEAKAKASSLSKRQQAELDFYLREYGMELRGNIKHHSDIDLWRRDTLASVSLAPAGIFYKDALFTFSVKPVAGVRYYARGDSSVYHRWQGAQAYGCIGKHIGFYTSISDHYESEPLVRPAYFTQSMGALYKGETANPHDYSEARGGVMISWNWGSLGLVKDHFEWGNNYNGANIFSGRTPSFTQIKLHVKPAKWLDFNYVHGWLVSEVVDSLRTYVYGNGSRIVYHDKYLAANMLTVTPFKQLNISVGNSIVYSDIGIHPAYLIPVMFYKSVDHSLNGTANLAGQNGQMFFDVSSRQIRHLHLFASVFVDEISFSRMWKKDKQSNYLSGKAGFRLSDWPCSNVSLTFEYTRTNPLAYQHFIPTTTFESNRFNLGHYLRDNSDEYYIALEYKPLRGLSARLSWTDARHGNDYVYGQVEPWGLPFMKDVTWENKSLCFDIGYELIYNGNLFLQLRSGDISGNEDKYTPPFFHGDGTTVSAGFNIGF